MEEEKNNSHNTSRTNYADRSMDHLLGVTLVLIILQRGATLLAVVYFCAGLFEHVGTAVAHAHVFPTLFAVHVRAADRVATIPFARPRLGLAADQAPAAGALKPDQPTEQRWEFEPEH